MTDLRPFLRLQTSAWLTALRDKLAADILSNTRYVSLSVSGKSGSQAVQVDTAELAQQLTEVLVARNLQGSDYVAPTRMTAARFA